MTFNGLGDWIFRLGVANTVLTTITVNAVANEWIYVTVASGFLLGVLTSALFVLSAVAEINTRISAGEHDAE